MKNIQFVAILVVVAVVAAGGSYVLASNGNNGSSDNGPANGTIDGVTKIVTSDPARDTATGGGRLWILGNANMDDVLDEKDVEWIQKIIDGTANEIVFNANLSQWSEPARMADANNDGIINQADIDKVRSLIAATPTASKQILYYVDVDGAVNSMHFPAKTIISTYEQNTKQLLTLDVMDQVVGVDEGSSKLSFIGDRFKDDFLIPSTVRFDPPAETLLGEGDNASDAADIVVTGTRIWYYNEVEKALPADRTNLDIVRISSYEDNNVLAGTLTLGFMLCESDKAMEYVEWCDKIITQVEEKTSTLTLNEKTKVLLPRGQYDNWATTFNGPRGGKYETSISAGAYNLIDENLTSSSTNITVSEEWVLGLGSRLDQIVSIVYGGFEDASFKNYTNAEYLEMTKDYYSGKVDPSTEFHVLDNIVGQGTTYIVGVIYMAKWFYPDLFADMDPDALFQDYIDKFMPGFDFDVSEHGHIAI